MSNENESGLFSCPVMCWIIGALLGLATYLILAGRFAMSTPVSLIVALVVFAIAGFLLGRAFCRASGSTHAHPARHDHDISATRQSVVAADSSGAMVSGVPEVVEKTTSNGGAAAAAAGAATASKASSAAAVTKPAAKAKSTGAAKGKTKSASAAGTTAKKAAAKPAAKAKAAAKPAAKSVTKPAAKTKAAAKPAAATKAASKPAAKKPAAKPAAKAAAKKPAAKTATKPARKPVAKDGKPEMLKKARAGGADDLKQIKGVGPKLEGKLNEMGLYHFDQVAGWRAKEVEWADNNLVGFKGRVSRDEWVKQAKVLAKGGQTEFSKKVAKGGVYEKNKK